MVDETLYITPHEAALAVVATAMKKARLKLHQLVINSIVGGILFSAGGMLAMTVQADSPTLTAQDPGIVHILQGLLFPIGLFYVIVMGAELYNSNVLYFTVGVCRGAVSILDLLVSWFVSWLFNLAGNLFVCYVICHLSGVTTKALTKQGVIDIAMEKFEASFFKTFMRGVAGNFFVCLAVYLQLLAKPYHVKLLLMGMPIFTFVSVGFTHVVADMFLVPMGMIEGAHIPVGEYIWKTLISASLGNAVGGAAFAIIIPYYLHLVVVEQDRKLLKLPEYEARDEQPELEMDSRVVRVPTRAQFSVTSTSDSSSVLNEKRATQSGPTVYSPRGADGLSTTVDLHPVMSSLSRRSQASDPLRSPPGVFPVMGMGEPLTRERTIAGNKPHNESDNDNDYVNDDFTNRPREDSGSLQLQDDISFLSRTMSIAASKKSRRKSQITEEQEYTSQGGYNAREAGMGETLKRVITRTKKNDQKRQEDPEMGLRRTSEDSGIGLFRTISNKFNIKPPESYNEINEKLQRHSITRTAAQASDNIAGIDNYDYASAIQRPPLVHQRSKPSYVSKKSRQNSKPLSPIHSDADDNNSSSSSNNNEGMIDKKLEKSDGGKERDNARSINEAREDSDSGDPDDELVSSLSDL